MSKGLHDTVGEYGFFQASTKTSCLELQRSDAPTRWSLWSSDHREKNL